MMKISVRFLIHSLIIGLISACGGPISYEEILEKEKASGEINNTLFLDIEFEMNSEEFFAHCWELNKQKVIRQGPGSQSVQYEPAELDYPGTMNFYPEFHEGKIVSMSMIFEYKSWAPWNKDLFSNKLAIDIKEMLEDWYGGRFYPVEHPDMGKVLLQVEGNRKIIIHPKDDRLVEVWMYDTRFEEKLESEGSL